MRAVVFALGAVLVATLTGCSDDDDKNDDNGDQGATFTCEGVSWEWECDDGKVELETSCGSNLNECQANVNQTTLDATSLLYTCDQNGKLEFKLDRACDNVTAMLECKIFSDVALWKVCAPASPPMAVV